MRYLSAAILMMGLVAGAAIAEDNSLSSLDDIMVELKSGGAVRAVFIYKDMQLISNNKPVERVPDAIGGMKLDTFEYFAEGSIGNPEAYLSSSTAVLINHPSYGIVYNYAKVRIYKSGKVQIVAQYINPKTYELEMNESFYCSIGTGAHFFRGN